MYQREEHYNFPSDDYCFGLRKKSPSGWLSCESVSPKFVKIISYRVVSQPSTRGLSCEPVSPKYLKIPLSGVPASHSGA